MERAQTNPLAASGPLVAKKTPRADVEVKGNMTSRTMLMMMEKTLEIEKKQVGYLRASKEWRIWLWKAESTEGRTLERRPKRLMSAHEALCPS